MEQCEKDTNDSVENAAGHNAPTVTPYDECDRPLQVTDMSVDTSTSCSQSSPPPCSITQKDTQSNDSADGMSSHSPSSHLVMLSSPIPNLVQSLRTSAVSAMKRTRQSLSEKLGHGSRTVDVQLEAKIEAVRDAQRRYTTLLQLIRLFTAQFHSLTTTQQSLATEFTSLSQKMPELHEEFVNNADTQRVLHKNGEILTAAMNFSANTLHTLCCKTTEDCLITVKQYEEARTEYDAYRVDCEAYPGNTERQQAYELRKQKFEQLRQTLEIKLELLNENRVKVLHQQLILVHNAIAAYFTGNQTALNDTMRQFNVPLTASRSSVASSDTPQ